MKSSDAQLEQLTAYLDGELNEPERREVEAQLARDPDAAAVLESLRRVSDSVAALPREAAPLSLSAAVQERMARRALLSQESSARQELPRLVIWTNRLAIAACFGLVCTAGWLGMQRRTVHAPVVVKNELDPKKLPPAGGARTEPLSKEFAFNTDSVSPETPASGWTDAPPAKPLESLVAFQDPGDVERKLIQKGVSNDELQQADLSKFSNQLVIETDDAETHDAIVKVVADVAQGNNILDANACRLPEPVQAQQAFFLVSHTQNRRAQAKGNEETWICVNAPAKAADEIMAGVQKVSARNKAPVQVEVNGCNMESPKQATQLLTMNTKLAQEMVNRTGDYRQNEVATPAPARGAPAKAASPENEKGGLEDEDAGSARREAPPPGKMASKAHPSKSTGYGAAKKDETKPGIETKDGDGDADAELERVTSDVDEAKRSKAFNGGAGGRDKTRPRGGIAKNEPVGDDANIRSTAHVKGGKTAPPVATVPPAPADACVTMSICVRNSAPQRARLGSAPATQASDTLRQPAATSRPQTSMPAAGDDRE